MPREVLDLGERQGRVKSVLDVLDRLALVRLRTARSLSTVLLDTHRLPDDGTGVWDDGDPVRSPLDPVNAKPHKTRNPSTLA
jgi:hypothetical protein